MIQAKLTQAQRDLDDVNLNLRYCTILTEIDGVTTRRDVNPANNVQVGQSLMAIRSLRKAPNRRTCAALAGRLAPLCRPCPRGCAQRPARE